MANIFDYLDWRADVPFSAASFNEVDNLILAKLAYTDFSGIVSSDGTKIQLSDACRLFFSQHTHEEIRANTSFTAKAPLLMEKMTEGQRFGNMTLRNYVEESGDGFQFSAVTFGLSDRTEYVAFRGTDGTVAGWKEDFNFSFMDETEGQRLAVRYLNGIKGKLRVGGHSKGGNLAEYASAFCNDQDRILEVYSNDGPGFQEKVIQRDEFQRILPKVKKIIPDSSIIGLLFSGGEEYTVVKSKAFGIMQHDGFTWLVNRNSFVNAPLSEMSRMAQRTIGSLLDKIEDEDMQTFTDLVFYVIESTGQDRFSSMNADKRKTAESIMNTLWRLPKEKQQEWFRLIGKLGMGSSQMISGFLSGLVKPRQ